MESTHKLNATIIVTSFMILFLELCVIRYLPSYIFYLGYFNNLILLASFLGLGTGFILGPYKQNLVHLFPFILFVLVVLAKYFSPGIDTLNNDLIFFGNVQSGTTTFPPHILLPLLFILVSLLFTCLGQFLAKLFITSTQPLKVYIFDLLGSILGVICFYFISFLGWPPVVWFLALLPLFVYLASNKSKLFKISLLILVLTTVLSIDTTPYLYWSPYYKINLVNKGNEVDLYTNNIFHQYFSKLDHADIYNYIFSQIVKNSVPSNDILIIGSGTGQDVAAALASGARHIDAVEIDPTILSIGEENHPEKPYQDPRVSIYNEDGRTFLKRVSKKYDVIIFAVTDSLIANSSLGRSR